MVTSEGAIPPGDHPENAASRATARAVWLDLAAGLVAIVFVVGTSIRAAFVGSDLRAMFAVSALGFFGAGVVRGRGGIANLPLKGLLVSSPGLLGTAALIANDGLHRLPVPIGVSLMSIACAAAGVQTRRWWRPARHWSLLLAAMWALAIGVGVPWGVPRLASLASFHPMDQAPAPFILAGPDGVSLRSPDLRGRVVVLDFWASWCLPCRWELPEIQAASAGFRDDPRVLFLAVDVGWEGETRERADRYLRAHGLTLSQAYDAGEAARILHVDSLPTVVVIDAGGHVRLLHHGFDRSERLGDQLVRVVRKLLAETSPRPVPTP